VRNHSLNLKIAILKLMNLSFFFKSLFKWKYFSRSKLFLKLRDDRLVIKFRFTIVFCLWLSPKSNSFEKGIYLLLFKQEIFKLFVIVLSLHRVFLIKALHLYVLLICHVCAFVFDCIIRFRFFFCGMDHFITL